MRNTALLIAGPTASGKSALALRLSERLGGMVVNADSMQVYRDLRVITARPTPEEESRTPHRLYGHVDGAVNHSAGLYAREMDAVLEEARQTRRIPILVGGTGLYFRALTLGLSDMPSVPEAVRRHVREWAQGQPAASLHAALARRHAGAAEALRPSDTQRIIRALEILEATGHPPAHFHARRTPGPLAGWRRISVFLAPERAPLHEAINTRFEAMLEEGALAEVAALGARQLDPALPLMRAHGVPALLEHLRGTMTLQDAARRGQADTRAYVKRQFTWFRQQMPEFSAVEPARAWDAVMGTVTAPP
jgi:tRNA dimethylallyltransferase